MVEFFNSKFVKDLQGGKLPPVEVTVSAETLVQIGAVIVFSGVIIILIAKILNR